METSNVTVSMNGGTAITTATDLIPIQQLRQAVTLTSIQIAI